MPSREVPQPDVIILTGKILSEMSAPTFLSPQGCLEYEIGRFRPQPQLQNELHQPGITRQRHRLQL